MNSSSMFELEFFFFALSKLLTKHECVSLEGWFVGPSGSMAVDVLVPAAGVSTPAGCGGRRKGSGSSWRRTQGG